MDPLSFIDKYPISSNNHPSLQHQTLPNYAPNRDIFALPSPSHFPPLSPLSLTDAGHGLASNMSPMQPSYRRPREDPVSPDHFWRPSPGISHPSSPNAPFPDHVTSGPRLSPVSADNPPPDQPLLSPFSLQGQQNFTATAPASSGSCNSNRYTSTSNVSSSFFGATRLSGQSAPAPEVSEHVKLLINT